MRPSVPGVKLPAEVAGRLPRRPRSSVDLVKAAARKTDVDQGWAKAVLGK